jgi:hypothetical protein
MLRSIAVFIVLAVGFLTLHSLDGVYCSLGVINRTYLETGIFRRFVLVCVTALGIAAVPRQIDLGL